MQLAAQKKFDVLLFLSLDRMARVKELRGEGHSFTRIGKQLGISKQRAAQLFQMA